MSDGSRVDAMSIAILKDKEKDEYVDYVFVADVWGKDPRFKERHMIIGQNRGLFRIDKKTRGCSKLCVTANQHYKLM